MADAGYEMTADADPQEQIDTLVDGKTAEIHTVIPGIIEKFDPATCLADVRPALKRRFSVNGEDGETVAVKKELPVIPNVPVAFPRGGGFAITWPLKKGDPCLLLISERSIDSYIDSDGKAPVDPDDSRTHDLSDAICYPGMTTKKSPAARAHATHLVIGLEDGTGELHIAPDGKFHLGTPTADKALALAEKVDGRLGDLEAFAATHMHPTAAPGPPSPGALPDPFIPPVGQTTGSTRVFTDA